MEVIKALLFPGAFAILSPVFTAFLGIHIPKKWFIFLLIVLFLIGILFTIRSYNFKKINKLQIPFIPIGFISFDKADYELFITYNELEKYIVQVQLTNRSPLIEMNPKNPSLFAFRDIEGPKCPHCDLDLIETRSFFGKYKHYCPHNHVSFKNNFSNHTMEDHTKEYVKNEIKTNGISNFLQN